MNSILRQIRPFRHRHVMQRLWNFCSVGLLIAGVSSGLMVLSQLTLQAAVSPVLVITAVLLSFSVSAALEYITRPSILETAKQIDDVCGFSDRIQTACQFAQVKHNSPVMQLQLKDAEAILTTAAPEKIVPIQRPQSWNWGIVVSYVAFLLASVSDTPEQIFTPSSSVQVSSESAARFEKSLRELRELLRNQQTPNFEAAAATLVEQLRDLQESAKTTEETLATLSEMDAVLTDALKHISDSTTATHLQRTGHALMLADSLQTVGKAMASGDFQEAAENLETSSLPVLSSRTLTAVNEKLRAEMSEAAQSGDQRREGHRGDGARAEAAIRELAQSLATGDQKKFEDAKTQLADECRDESVRQQLSELIQQQQRSLNDFRAEIDQQQQIAAKDNSGGLTAGREPGRAGQTKSAPILSSSQELELTGLDTGSGDSETDSDSATRSNPSGTTSSAVRDYREQYEKHQYLNEAALKSESIPLGHRQTIRRYFELIRPSDAESR